MVMVQQTQHHHHWSQDAATARRLAFSREVSARCVTLDGDDFNPSGLLTGACLSMSSAPSLGQHATATFDDACQHCCHERRVRPCCIVDVIEKHAVPLSALAFVFPPLMARQEPAELLLHLYCLLGPMHRKASAFCHTSSCCPGIMAFPPQSLLPCLCLAPSLHGLALLPQVDLGQEAAAYWPRCTSWQQLRSGWRQHAPSWQALSASWQTHPRRTQSTTSGCTLLCLWSALARMLPQGARLSPRPHLSGHACTHALLAVHGCVPTHLRTHCAGCVRVLHNYTCAPVQCP